MRLFTALALPPHIVNALAPYLYRQPPGNLHITVAFLGEQPDERLSDILTALMRVPRRDPISIEVAGFGYFPDHENPRVMWAGLQPTEPLRELTEDIRATLTAGGVQIEADSYRYTPHITIAQLDGQPLPADPQPETFGSFTAARFHLYRSERGAYTQLSSFGL